MHRWNLSSCIALLALALIAASILPTSLLRTRADARMFECANRFKTITLAMHQYHSAYKRLPPASGGTFSMSKRTSNLGRLSGFAGLLPFLDQAPAWEALSNWSEDRAFPPMGPAPSMSPSEYPLWGVQFDVFLCPSETSSKGDYGMRSYSMCYGDGIKSVGRPLFETGSRTLNKQVEAKQNAVARGVFIPNRSTRFRDIIDGLSNTIMLGETIVESSPSTVQGAVARNVKGISNDPSVVLRLRAPGVSNQYKRDVSLWSVAKGSRWAEGSFIVNGFTTVLPPGSPSATEPLDPFTGVVSASSHHPDGVHVGLCNGAVLFVSEEIDCGDLSAKSVCMENGNAGSKSPYGVWGALGTRNSKEIIPSEREAAFKKLSSY